MGPALTKADFRLMYGSCTPAAQVTLWADALKALATFIEAQRSGIQVFVYAMEAGLLGGLRIEKVSIRDREEDTLRWCVRDHAQDCGFILACEEFCGTWLSRGRSTAGASPAACELVTRTGLAIGIFHNETPAVETLGEEV